MSYRLTASSVGSQTISTTTSRRECGYATTAGKQEGITSWSRELFSGWLGIPLGMLTIGDIGTIGG